MPVVIVFLQRRLSRTGIIAFAERKPDSAAVGASYALSGYRVPIGVGSYAPGLTCNVAQGYRSCCRLYHFIVYMTTIVIRGGFMRKIQLKDAKANLSAVVDQATQGKPSVITRHGKPEAVVLGFADWQRLSRVPSFGRLLMSVPLEPGDLPERNRGPMRDAGL